MKWMIGNIVQTNISRGVAIEGRHGGSCLPPTLISEPKKFQHQHIAFYGCSEIMWTNNLTVFTVCVRIFEQFMTAFHFF